MPAGIINSTASLNSYAAAAQQSAALYQLAMLQAALANASPPAMPAAFADPNAPKSPFMTSPVPGSGFHASPEAHKTPYGALGFSESEFMRFCLSFNLQHQKMMQQQQHGAALAGEPGKPARN